MTGKIRVTLGTLLSVGLMIAAFVPGVSASGSVKSYSAAAASPATVSAASTTTFTFKITNSTSSTNTLGSVQVTLPSGFSGLTIGTASAPAGPWQEIAGSGVLLVDTPSGTGKLNPGQSVTFSLTATAPTQTGVYTWTTAAKPSSDFSGTSLFTISGQQPSVTVVSPPATSLSITNLPAGGATAGQPFAMTVKALNALGGVANGYVGTVHFTTSDAGSGVALPADYTFTPGDQGVHTFAASTTLTTAGQRSLTATDTANATITGTASLAVRAGSATGLAISASSGSTAGSSIAVSVTAHDGFGNQATGYAGTLSFTTSDHGAQTQLPAAYTFTSGDAGTHGFTVVLTTAGPQTVTASDGTLTSTIAITVAPAGATALQVSGLPTSAVGAGTAFSATVTAVDAFGNVATGYQGTVHLTTSDGNQGVVLPADYTFTPGDAGVHVFSAGFALITLGAESITATDAAHPALSGSGGVTVKPGPASKLAIVSVTDEGTGLPAPVRGQPFDVTFVTEDAFGNVSPVSQPTSFALSRQAGSGTLSGNLAITIAAGQSQGTIPGALYSVAENGVILAISATAGDTLQSAQTAVNVQSFATSIVGTPGVAVTLTSNQCTAPSPQVPTCAFTTFRHGVNGKAFYSEGVCLGITTGCLQNGGETSLLVNVIANLKDANGNPLYSRTDPALTIVACDKSLCAGNSISKYLLIVDINGNGQYVQAPACPSKGTIAPTGVPFCVDYVTSHRDNAGDTLLYFDFAIDYIVHYG